MGNIQADANESPDSYTSTPAKYSENDMVMESLYCLSQYVGGWVGGCGGGGGGEEGGAEIICSVCTKKQPD